MKTDQRESDKQLYFIRIKSV